MYQADHLPSGPLHFFHFPESLKTLNVNLCGETQWEKQHVRMVAGCLEIHALSQLLSGEYVAVKKKIRYRIQKS